MPENLHTKNINTYEQTLNINIKPLQATYKHPAPSTPLLYIFFPHRFFSNLPQMGDIGMWKPWLCNDSEIFPPCPPQPKVFCPAAAVQKLQGHESSLQRHTLKFHMSTDLFLGSNVRNGILSLLCLDAMKFNQKYAWPNYDNGSHLSNTLSTKHVTRHQEKHSNITTLTQCKGIPAKSIKAAKNNSAHWIIPQPTR